MLLDCLLLCSIGCKENEARRKLVSMLLDCLLLCSIGCKENEDRRKLVYLIVRKLWVNL